jgi:WD40 repeat protein
VQSVRFSPDGKWVVTASQDKTARVWDAQTSEPLTPPLAHAKGLFQARFLPDGLHLVTSDTISSWVWDLTIEQRPAEDLVLLGTLFSGADPGAEKADAGAQSLKNIWTDLRKKYPKDFRVSEEQIASWHAWQAQQSESSGISSAS